MTDGQQSFVILNDPLEAASIPVGITNARMDIQSSSKIYGRIGRKRYLVNLQDLLKGSLVQSSHHICCFDQQNTPKSNQSLRSNKKIVLDNLLNQPKENGCLKKVCKCHPMNQNRQKSVQAKPKKVFYNKKKLENIRLPSIKNFQLDDLQSKHKVNQASQQIITNISCLNNSNHNRLATPDSGVIYSKSQLKYHNNPESSLTNHRQRNIESASCLQLSANVILNRNETTMFHHHKQIENHHKQIENPSKILRKSGYSMQSTSLFKIPEQQQYSSFINVYKPLDSNFNLSHLLHRPNFKIIPAEDEVYFGEAINNVKNGEGVTVSKKQVYEGKYQNNLKLDGCEKNQDGIYRGEFENGRRNGNGSFVWNNGQIFEGQWKDGKKNGYGVWKSLKGDSYEGQWKNNRQCGIGVFRHRGGSVYNGAFHDFLKEGQGTEQFPNGDIYKGLYSEGKPHGYGEYQWAKGDRYLGNFVNGSRSGEGKFINKNGDVYEGEFKNDKKHGIGTQQYKSGERFEGEFKDGNIQKGVIIGINGNRIEIKGK